MTSWTRSPAAWALLARMVLWRTALPVLTRALPLERVVRMLARPRTRPHPAGQKLAIRAAGRLWRKADAPCLQRSLALYRELGGLGADATLVCGLAHEGGELVGHAWVELDGTPLLEPADPRERYETVLAFDSEGARKTSE